MDSSLSKELNLQSLIAKLESKDWMRVFGSINTTKRIAMSHSTLLLPILIVGKRIWYDWMKVVLSRNEFCGKSPPCHLVECDFDRDEYEGEYPLQPWWFSSLFGYPL
ncbi:hypothetical protein ACHQM5_029444 [Ranunculus cassubicifolius]